MKNKLLSLSLAIILLMSQLPAAIAVSETATMEMPLEVISKRIYDYEGNLDLSALESKLPNISSYDSYIGALPRAEFIFPSVSHRDKDAIIPAFAYPAIDGDSSEGSRPPSQQLFSEDRVIVKLVSNTRMRTSALNLGLSYYDVRMLNPSVETSDINSFSTASINDTQNNMFSLTLEETGRDAVLNAVAVLNANPAVEYAEPNYLYRISQTPNDPMFDIQYPLEKINAIEAWGITTGSKNIVVGVIDTGINGSHPDLIDNLWTNPNPGQGGYLNDIHGYDFAGRAGGIPTDENGHGTHVAGIIGAKGNNGLGVTGVNWDVSLAWLGVSAGGDWISLEAAIEALNYANNHGILITNNSWGGGAFSEALFESIANYAGLFVAAAGNDSSNNDMRPAYPASYNLPNIISVSSTTASDHLSEFSNFGKNSSHIAAPGSEIMSTHLNGSFEEYSGTSMASPHVAGVAALIKAVRSDWSPLQVKAAIYGTARQTALPVMSGGILDAHAALQVGTLLAVTFDFNDGIRVPSIDYAVTGRKLPEPVWPEKEGFAFTGWYTQPVGGSLYDFDNAVTENLMLYAQWSEVQAGMYSAEFPDASFRRAVVRLINERDGRKRTEASIVSIEDKNLLASFEQLDVSYMGIRDLTGLEYFTGLTGNLSYWSAAGVQFGHLSADPGLNVNGNLIEELDVSNNINLKVLYCDSNILSNLDVSKNTLLEVLLCRENQMEDLNVSNLPSLKVLWCDFNDLTELDLSGCAALEWLICSMNQLTDLNLSDCAALEALWFAINSLSTLDVSKNAKLYSLLCHDNKLTSIDLSRNSALRILITPNNQLTALNVSNNAALEVLFCWNNRLARLDVSENTALLWLDCADNSLSALELPFNGSLIVLDSSNNQLPELDVSGFAELKLLACRRNLLMELDTSRNTALLSLFCEYNSLTTLDITGNVKIGQYEQWWHPTDGWGLGINSEPIGTVLDCSYNNMKTPADVMGWQNIDKLELAHSFIFHPQLDWALGNEITPAFSDPVFLAAVRDLICKPDGPILGNDVAWIIDLNVSDIGISSLSGIEFFLMLETLLCSNNQLTELDVSNNKVLRTIVVDNNKITAIDVSKNIELQVLDVVNNRLTSLEVSENPALLYLYCSDNQLTFLDVSKNPALTNLYCSDNRLTTLDISNNHELIWLIASNNQLTSLDVSNNPAFSMLRCQNNFMDPNPDVSVNGWQFLWSRAEWLTWGTVWGAGFLFFPQNTPPLTIHCSYIPAHKRRNFCNANRCRRGNDHNADSNAKHRLQAQRGYA